MSVTTRLAVVTAAVLFFCNAAVAQFLPEDQIPLDIQEQLIADVIAEHGHLDMSALQQAFQDWLLAQPLPDADGHLLDSGACSNCVPPTDGEDPRFNPVRDVQIITRADGRIRSSFKVKWRRPQRLSPDIRDLYELDSYEVFLTRDDGTYEHHVITKTLLADGTEKLPRRIRFRRRAPGDYTVSVRPVYVPAQPAVAAASDSGKSDLAATTSASRAPLVRSSSGSGGKGPWGGGGGATLSPTDQIDTVFGADGALNNVNNPLAECIYDNGYLGGQQLQEIEDLDCTGQSNLITNIQQADNFSGLITLKIPDHAITSITPVQDLPDVQLLDISGNTGIDLSPLAQMQDLAYLFIDDLGLSALPVLASNNLITYSLAGNQLGNGSFICSGLPPALTAVGFLDLSSNGLGDADLPLLEDYSVSNLKMAGNAFQTMQPPSGCPVTLLDAYSLDISGNTFALFGGGGGLDLSAQSYFSLNLSNAVNLTELSTGLPQVCLEMNLQGNSQLSKFAGEYASRDELMSELPDLAPFQLLWSDSDGFSCQDRDAMRTWWRQNQGQGDMSFCSIRPDEIFMAPDSCQPGEVRGFSVTRNADSGHHVLDWETLFYAADEANLVYEVDKRRADLGYPADGDNNTGVIGQPYVYSGAIGGAVVSDLDVQQAYEFRIRLCNQDLPANPCGPWNKFWHEGGYPLTKAINIQATWLEIGDDPTLRLSWSYPQSFLASNPPAGFAIYAGDTLLETVPVGFSGAWSSSVLDYSSGEFLYIRTCASLTGGLDCNIALTSPVILNPPPELDVTLQPPDPVGSDSGAINQEYTLRLQNTQPDVEADNTTIVDYYRIKETSSTSSGIRTYYQDISGQTPNQTTFLPTRNNRAGTYEYEAQACFRNRNGADICSGPSAAVSVNVPASPGYNAIQETLCYRGQDPAISLEWTYSDTDTALPGVQFDQPAYYYVDAVNFADDFFVAAGDIEVNGVSVLTQNPSGAPLNTLARRIYGCPNMQDQQLCQEIGYIQVTNTANLCQTAPPQIPDTPSSGGPELLNPGYWTNQNTMPRQGWAFYWASDLRYENIHEQYGDTYDLLAYWSTYRRIYGRWTPVWVYAELVEISEGQTAAGCSNAQNRAFRGALYYPEFVSGVQRNTNVGNLLVCFDPDSNNDVEITVTSNLDRGLNTGAAGFSTALRQITYDETAFPQDPQGNPIAIAPNPHDYLNGSYQFDESDQRVVSWSSGYLEAEVMFGFDNLGQPMWVNGIINCNDPAHSAQCSNGFPKLDAGVYFRTPAYGIDPLNSDISHFDDVIALTIDPGTNNGPGGEVNTVIRSKQSSVLDTAGSGLSFSGDLTFTIPNETGGVLRQVAMNFDSSQLTPVRRESNFHDIRFYEDSDPGVIDPQSCTLVNGECNITMTWFSDADFVGDALPAIEPFYQYKSDGASTWGAYTPLADLCEGPSGSVPSGFVVQNYGCSIGLPGDYRFMLRNRLNEPAATNVIAITTGTLTVYAEGTNANDDLGVSVVGDAPLATPDDLPGNPQDATAHDHDQIIHNAGIGTLAGQASVSGGAATYSIPINIPPGRQGMQPSVSLNYNSRAGNGTLGMGWSLSAGSAISRCPSTIAQDGFSKGVTYDNTDRLCLDGQRLMLVSGAYWGTGSTYRTEIDGFALISLNGAGTAATSGCTHTFTVQSKDNITRVYGDGDNQRVNPEPINATACVTNSWLLTTETDQANNNIRYDYDEPAGDGERLMSRIRYTGSNLSFGNRELQLVYENRPGDEAISYLNGYRTEQTKRLKTIRTFVDRNGSDSNWIREYRLVYSPSAATGRSLLTTVTECAREGTSGQTCLPATTFAWGDDRPLFDWGKVQSDQDGDGTFEDLISTDPLLVSVDGSGVQLHPNAGRIEQMDDLDGDGSKELFFQTPDGGYIVSIDAEGQEKWRVSTSDPLGNVDSPAAQTEASRTSIEQYVATLDLEAQLSSSMGRAPTQAEIDALAGTMTDELMATLEDFLAVHGTTRSINNSVDFNDDGITDSWGFRTADDGTNDSIFHWYLRRPASGQGNQFSDYFDVIATTLRIPAADLDSTNASVGDFNGDGAEDVFTRVSIDVTDMDGDFHSTTGLQLWINDGDTDSNGVIDYSKYAGASVIPPTQTNTNGIEGVIYIWPYNIALGVDPDDQYQAEIATGTHFEDVNGDGLQDIVISSQLLDIAYIYEVADLDISAVVSLGFSDAPVRVLLNQSSAVDQISFDIVEYSDGTTVAANSDPYSRGDQSLGLYSDPRLTYQLPMDINSDGLNDYVFIPNAADSTLTSTSWYVQINQGQPSGGSAIYSAPIEIVYQDNIYNAMDVSSNSVLRSPRFGNLIKPIDWDNDGETELMIPRAIETPICVSRYNGSYAPGTPRGGNNGNDQFGVYCPTNTNGIAPVGPVNQSSAAPDDFNGATVVNGNPHYEGYGHLDRSTYQMGILEFGPIDDATNTITARLVDYSATGLISSVRSTVADSRGDGITDIFTVYGCQQEIDSAPVGPSQNNSPGNPYRSRCVDNPLGYTDVGYTTWWGNLVSQGIHTDDALTQRGYYITRNMLPRDQILDLMTSTSDGFGNQSSWTYAPLSANPPERAMETNIPLYVVPDRAVDDGYLEHGAGEYFYFASSMYVVSQFDQSNGLYCDLGAACMGLNKLQNTTYYGYEEAVYNNQGRGFQGFRKVVSEQVVSNPLAISDDQQNNLRNVSVFHQIFPLAGRLEGSYTQLASIAYDPMQDRTPDGSFNLPANVLTSSQYEWGCRAASGSMSGPGQYLAMCNIDGQQSGGIEFAQAQVTENIPGDAGIYHPMMFSSLTLQKELGGGIYTATANTGIAFDAYGNRLTGVVTETHLDGGPALTHTQAVTNAYESSETEWWLGKLIRSETAVTSDYPGDAEAASEQTKITTQLVGYDNTLRKPNCMQLVDSASTATCGNATGIWQQTDTLYDSYGNPIQVTVDASDLPAPRTTTTGYTASDGYFPDTITNAEQHMVTTVVEPREGNPTRVTDANGLITRMAYDPFGRELETWYPDHLINGQAGPDDVSQHYAPRSSVRYSPSCNGMPGQGVAYCMTRITDGAPLVQQTYDALNRVIRTHSAGFGNTTTVTEQTYNARGQVVADTVPRYSTAGTQSTYSNEYRFDPLGRMVYKVQPQQARPDLPVEYRHSHYLHAGLTTTVVVGDNPTNPGCVISSLGSLDAGVDICVQRTYAGNGWLLSTVDAHGETTGFFYDGQGNPTVIVDADGHRTTASYNHLGQRTQLHDPNMGDWSYQYNGLGEVISQTDARQQTFTFDYDLLGRLRERNASCPAGSAAALLRDVWTYDLTGKGLLDTTERDDCDGSSLQRWYEYDSYTRPAGTRQIITNTASSVSQIRMLTEYDSYFARPTSTTWRIDSTGDGGNAFDAMRMYNKYDINGYVFEQGDSRDYVGTTAASYRAANGGAWRQIQAMTPAGQISQQRYRNGLVETMDYTPATWQLFAIDLPSRFPDSPPLMNYDYQYDLFGNLKQQTSQSLTGPGGDETVDHESFSYDRLHRLLTSDRTHSIGGTVSTSPQLSYEYDRLGNMLRKSDHANNALYEYGSGGVCQPGPNAVINVGAGNSYSYDCNGNMLTGPNRMLSYNAYNKPARIADGGNIAINEFWYDADEQRYLQRKEGLQTTVYLDKAYERTGNVHKLYLDDFAVFTVDYQNNGQDTGITYLHKDRLGSVAVMSVDNGDPLPNAGRGYDPYGKPREGDWQDSDHQDNASAGAAGDLNAYKTTTRGFTGHEHLNESDLIHMNGRTYDYNLGRFLSVDPYIQFPTNSQSLNSYSYIMNNPMSGTDPSGYLSECDPEVCQDEEPDPLSSSDKCDRGHACGGGGVTNGRAEFRAGNGINTNVQKGINAALQAIDEIGDISQRLSDAPDSAAERGKIFAEISEKLAGTEGSIYTAFFDAAAAVNGNTSLGSIDGGAVGDGFNELSESTEGFLQALGQFVFVFNQDIGNRLIAGNEILGLEGLRESDLDQAIVGFEQTLVQHFLDTFNSDQGLSRFVESNMSFDSGGISRGPSIGRRQCCLPVPSRQSVIDDVNSAFNGPFTRAKISAFGGEAGRSFLSSVGATGRLGSGGRQFHFDSFGERVNIGLQAVSTHRRRRESGN